MRIFEEGLEILLTLRGFEPPEESRLGLALKLLGDPPLKLLETAPDVGEGNSPGSGKETQTALSRRLKLRPRLGGAERLLHLVHCPGHIDPCAA